MHIECSGIRYVAIIISVSSGKCQKYCVNVTRIIYYSKLRFYDNTIMIIDIVVNGHTSELVVVCFIFI